VYRVRGANALWHHDGNEKLKPWGFYIHGLVDGFSRLIIYLICCNNKRAATVENIFMTEAVGKYGWPSRVRGDYGKENNGVERRMIQRRGREHHPYLRGRCVMRVATGFSYLLTMALRSTQNIRMERNWRDVRRDTIQLFREIFQHLESTGLLDMGNAIERVCLFLVFLPRIQASLNETRDSWNLHKLRTEHCQTPQAIYELSRTKAIRAGYWPDPGDDAALAVQPEYGVDEEAPAPPADELAHDPNSNEGEQPNDAESQRDAGIFVTDDGELEAMQAILGDFDFTEEDGNFGIDVYCRAVELATAHFLSA